MKIKIKKLFRYQDGPRDTRELQPGVYEVGKDITDHVAHIAQRFGGAKIVVEKKAPENKVVNAPENKSKVAKKSGNRRSTRSKPNK